jgi:hypothetical protein
MTAVAVRLVRLHASSRRVPAALVLLTGVLLVAVAAADAVHSVHADNLLIAGRVQPVP